MRIVYRDYPLPSHPRAMAAAEAAQCAHDQGRFWDYHDLIFANPQTLEDADLKKFARDLELDGDRFDQCVDKRQFGEVVQRAAQGGAQLGVAGTPAFFVNGRFLSGAQPFEAFQQAIDDELQREPGAS